MRLFKSALVMLSMGAMLSTTLQAKCFHFSRTSSDTYICVAGNDSNARKKAKQICDSKVAGCGSIVGDSNVCYSNKGNCYDANGNGSKKIKMN